MKDFKPVFLGIITLCILWVVYFYTVKLPQDNRDALLLKEIKLENCYNLAEADYKIWWGTLCEKYGLNSDCLLTNQQADNFQSALVSRRITCQNLYK